MAAYVSSSPTDPPVLTSKAEQLDSSFTAVDSVEVPLGPTCSLCMEHDWTKGDPVEDDLRRPVHGWPSLSQLMANTPDFAAFARFRDLNVKSLLYYQAELTDLRTKLHRLEWNDHRHGHFKNASRLTARIDKIILTEGSDDGREQRQWRLVKRMRTVLKEYNEALLLFSQISALPEPETYNVKSLRDWIRESFSVSGPGSETWGDLHRGESLKRQTWRSLIGDLIWPQEKPTDLDLVLTDPPRAIDPITKWVKFGFVPFWQSVRSAIYIRSQRTPNLGKDIEAQDITVRDSPWRRFEKRDYQKPTLATFSDKRLLRVISVLSTIVACLLPTLAITVLSQLHGLRDLLLCLAGFTVIFAFGLIFFTTGSATKLEVFVASAA
ncbi:uncharacterized protein PAC_09822 [Phialocephala subalpina]|uniref:DUF6594 domain-containing protein n=1 Tax=Phialocephala subalpina TaxID=576137 RepID=A0A1L7X4K2_9HELO|nr:uncharacterized protein PAC_09822 [Phialocephala subalpina]